MAYLRSILIAVTAILSTLTINSQSAKPDFAYPKKVSVSAKKELDIALSTGNGQKVIRSLVDYTIAQSLISTDNLPEAITAIEQVATKEKDPCICSLLYTMLCDIYLEIYDNDRWKYNRRNNPLLPLPDDYSTWDGNQFKHKIFSLCDSALSCPEALQASPLKDYKEIISFNNLSLTFYPSLYDFVARHIIDNLEQLSDNYSQLPLSWLCARDKYQNLQFTYTTPSAQRILSLYQQLLRINADKPAALIDCDIARIKYIADRQGQSGQKIFPLLQDLFYQYSDNKYAAEILISLYSMRQGDTHDKWLYSNIKSHINRFPDYMRRGCLQNLLNDLTFSFANLESRKIIIPGDSLEISIDNRNCRQLTIDIYKVPDSRQLYDNGFSFDGKSTKLEKVQSIHLSTDSVIPFRIQQSVKVLIEQPGYYIMAPDIDSSEQLDSRYYSTILCTDLAIMSSIQANKTWATVVNPKSGKPTESADIYTIYKDYPDKKTATTDHNGMSQIDITSGSYLAAFKDGNHSAMEYFHKWNRPEKSSDIYGSCYTDLAVYHPGDSVKWSAIIYSVDNDNRKLCKHQSFSARIYNTNHELYDSITLKTDEWGRISHSFKLPTDGLTGRWNIHTVIGNRTIAREYFTVSDYKLPTYFAEITEIAKGQPERGAVTLRGKSVTYTGFPVAEASVSLNLSVKPRYSWRASVYATAFYSAETTTDSNGNFTFVLPADLLSSSPIPNGVFAANITVTSQSGENQYTTSLFNNGKPYEIICNISSSTEIPDNNILKLPVRVSDFNGKTVDEPISYTLKSQNNNDSLSGIMCSGTPIINVSSLASGLYTMRLYLENDSLADPYLAESIILYRVNDSVPPIDTPLWIPKTRYETDSCSTSATIIYGTSYDNCHIEYAIYSGDKTYSRGWLSPSAGMHTFDIDFPAEIKDMNIAMRVTHNYECYTSSIKISRNNSNRSIVLKAESFRDRISPGSMETWTFSVTGNNNIGVKAALIFDMYSKALDKIQDASSSWTFAANPAHTYPFHFSFYHTGVASSSVYSQNRAKDSDCQQLSIPQIDTYGYSFFNSRHFGRLESARISTMSKSVTDIAVKNTTTSVDDLTAAIVEETSTENDTGLTNYTGQEHFSYRNSETPLAFFEPTLVTDEQGNFTYSFTVPNANTTWRFNAIAYNDSLLSDNLSADVIANKPLMVQPNLPRFLRTGDKAVIQASVMNNSDTIQTVNTTIEIFDPADGVIINRYTYADTISGQQAAIVSCNIEISSDRPMLGFRIKTTNGFFSDGEQSVIAILPSITPVIETKNFYMSAESHNKTIKLPYVSPDSHVTLQFCENPVWYCITALPGLRNSNVNTSTAAMSAIFSAAVSDGILRNNPEIASALHQWSTGNDNDSMLVSMLNRNQDLKDLLLNETPWVMDARSDTQRMERLALLFDKKEIKDIYADNLKILSQMQCDDGGWKWMAQSQKASYWSTINILAMCGQLMKAGYKPDNKQLDIMIEKAVKYIDDFNARQYNKAPNADYTQYTYIRSFFPDIKQSTAASRVTASTVQKLISGWKDLDIAGKAIAATLLNNNRYHSTARQILSSMREYARYSPEEGMWWPSLNNSFYWTMDKIGISALALDAFHEVEPSCDDIDKIRQWIILQKEGLDWGTSITASHVISSLINTGSRWTRPAQNVTVSIDGTDVHTDMFERYTGFIRTDLSSMNPSGKSITISKPASTPAWGAVFMQYSQTMSEVNAFANEDISIEKTVLKRRDTADGIKWEKTDSFDVGDVIKTQLTVKAGRDLDYVTITDDRAACLEPVEQLPEPILAEGIYFYRENRDNSTNLFIDHLPKGTYIVSYELSVNNAGVFSAGIATIQSQYAPQITAHSSGTIIKVAQ